MGQMDAVAGVLSFSVVPEGNFFSLNGLDRLRVWATPKTNWANLPGGPGSLEPGVGIVAVRGLIIFEAGQPTLIAARVRLLP